MKPSTSAKPRPTAIVLISDTLCGMGGSGRGVQVFYNGICISRKKHAVKTLTRKDHPTALGTG